MLQLLELLSWFTMLILLFKIVDDEDDIDTVLLS